MIKGAKILRKTKTRSSSGAILENLEATEDFLLNGKS